MSKSFQQGKDLTGKRFGRLTVLEFVPNDKKESCWKCMCDCGNIYIVRGRSLKTGNTKSCGCAHLEQVYKLGKSNETHGATRTRLYRIWINMKKRCYYPQHTDYKVYGGRGITVCDEWKDDFMAFYNWSMNNGYTDILSIDRIEVNGNYTPCNCRWVDMKTQQRNRRNNVIIEYQGEKMTLAEAAEKSGIKHKTLIERHRKGDNGKKLFRPVESK